MKEQDSSFSPEAIDALTGREQGKQLLPDEQRLIRDVYSLSHKYARENERSLERIWNRLAQQGQEQPARIQQQETGTPGLFREGKAMPQKDIYQELLQERRQQGNYQEREFSTLDSQPVKRAGRSRWRALGMSAAAAVVVLTILSWAVLSAGLHHGPQRTHVASQQPDIHTGTLLCSFSVDSQLKGDLAYAQPTLDWSANGQIAAAYSTLKTVSGQNCAQGAAFTGTFTQFAEWSPNGKQLLISKKDDSRGVEVVDAKTGNVVATFVPQQGSTSTASVHASTTTGLSFLDSLSGGPNPVDGAIKGVVQSVWSADGTQVISAIDESHVNGPTSAASVQIWNASTGTLVRTALTFGANVQFLGGNSPESAIAISPDGKYVAVQVASGSIQVWSIASGKQVSTIPFTTIPSGTAASDLFNYLPSAVAWSPDSASLALGSIYSSTNNANSMQVWSVANGQLTATFHDTDDPTSNIGTLAWSPDGKYLAESYSDIHIWDVNANKLVATFGKVTTKQGIYALAWSPDGKMLASSVQNNAGGDPRPNTMNVWQLS